MDTNKMREQFEQWAKGRYSWHLHDDARDPEDRTIASWNGEAYGNRIVEGMWQSWQASREAVVVELPPKISAHNTSESGWVRPEAEHYDEAIDDCREAIEFLGLKVAP